MSSVCLPLVWFASYLQVIYKRWADGAGYPVFNGSWYQYIVGSRLNDYGLHDLEIRVSI